MANSLIGVSCGMDNFDKRFGQVISSDVIHPVELTEKNFVEAVNGDADFVKKLVPFAADDENSNCDEKKKKTTFVDFNGMPVNDPLPIFPLSMTLEDVFKTLQADVRFLPTLVALKKLNLKIPQLLINGNIGGRANRYGLVDITDANGQIVLASSGIARHKKNCKMSENLDKEAAKQAVYLRAIDNIKEVTANGTASVEKISSVALTLLEKMSSESSSLMKSIVDTLKENKVGGKLTPEDVLMDSRTPTPKNE
ncbi:unnamed protein product [Meloidogyne enterolobii]|uniref:Uncharacterized protein n=1 Tax=Meloidogyne enterolobii TaxID=390850 RepID=A0ACB0YKP3_MELEN